MHAWERDHDYKKNVIQYSVNVDNIYAAIIVLMIKKILKYIQVKEFSHQLLILIFIWGKLSKYLVQTLNPSKPQVIQILFDQLLLNRTLKNNILTHELSGGLEANKDTSWC